MPPRGVKSKKRSRQYEKVLKSIKSEGRYKGRQKQVAARIVNKTAQEGRDEGQAPEHARPQEEEIAAQPHSAARARAQGGSSARMVSGFRPRRSARW